METVNEHNLPMEVREHMMRGQWDSAIKVLESEYGLEEEKARTLIRNYRENIKKRHLELELQKMQNEFGEEKDADLMKAKIYKYILVISLICWTLTAFISYITK